MSLNKDGIVVILSSPSGAGKTTLVKKIAQENSYNISVSHTTRQPRTNEIDGEDYFFVSNKIFQELVKNNEFLEYAKVFENYYGSSKRWVIENLNKGKNVIFDIDWQGTEQIKKKKINYKLITFFILPPSKSELFKRLKNRDMKDKNIVEKRMKQFNEDIDHWDSYDFVVINDDLNKCYREIIELINNKIENKDLKYNKKNILNHLKKLRN
ncbi:guanylate kinase [Candidatus Pelagibacter sp.]|nr:guanylate kinase [Candidatus Pelagibacter sp.]